jgi:DNA repair photolyase
MKSGICRTKEFAKKGLADYSVNVGLKCSHGCTYCSTGASNRRHRAFQELNLDPYDNGYTIVDPDKPTQVTIDAARIKNRGVVQLCTTVDAWAPEARKYNLGRRCLEALLAQPGWTIRILTKNAAVTDDFDIIQKHRDRVLVGLSLTGTEAKQSIIEAIEPNASMISERMVALEKAHRMGLRTYGMLCPLLPGIADEYAQVLDLVDFVHKCGAEEVFAEAVNPRGRGLILTADALRTHGYAAEAEAITAIRDQSAHSAYTVKLIRNVQRAMRKHRMIHKLRFLVYTSGLSKQAVAEIKRDDTGVRWL